MKNVFTILFFCCAYGLGMAQSINYSDNLGSTILEFRGLHNGKNSYSGEDAGFGISIFWTGTSWQINFANDGSLVPGAGVPAFANHAQTSPNPPDFNTGTWLDLEVDGANLTALSGDGTTNNLPVELVSFQGEATKEGIILSWQTASEEHNKGFELQHSVDGAHWSSITWLDGKGSTTVQQNYRYVHVSATSEVNYFRLKQVDFDGQYDYSDIIQVTVEQEKGQTVRLYPNPSPSGRITLDYVADMDMTLDVMVVDATGKCQREEQRRLTKGNNRLSFDFSTLPKGVYAVKFGEETRTLLIR